MFDAIIGQIKGDLSGYVQVKMVFEMGKGFDPRPDPEVQRI